MSGVIAGGWEWVGAAWGISLGVLFCYAIVLSSRLHVAQSKARAESERAAGHS